MLKMDLQTFARSKNAKREHYVAEYVVDEAGVVTEPTEGEWLRLAKWVPSITDSSTDTTETGGDYAGDGTPSTDVTAYAETWTATGTYDPSDAAQKLIVSKKREIGEGRKVWHRIVQTDGEVVQGVATATDIRGGSGDATAYEEFNVVLNFDTIPAIMTGLPEG